MILSVASSNWVCVSVYIQLFVFVNVVFAKNFRLMTFSLLGGLPAALCFFPFLR